MNEEKNKNIKIPNISIDEALRLYLSLIYPKGLPDGVDEDLFRAVLREKISKDRPDWEKKFKRKNESKIFTTEKSYSQLKQELIQKSRESEIPSDPDEKFFYFRAQEALRNRIMRKEVEKEVNKRNELIQKLIRSKKGNVYKPSLEKILEIKSIYEAKLRNNIFFQNKLPASLKEILLNLRHPQLNNSSHTKLVSPSFSNSSQVDHASREMNNLIISSEEKPNEDSELKKAEITSQNISSEHKKTLIKSLNNEEYLSLMVKKRDTKTPNHANPLSIKREKFDVKALEREKYFNLECNQKPQKKRYRKLYETGENLKIKFRFDKEKDMKLDKIEII